MMNQPQQQLPNMFPGVGMDNGMMMGGGPGVQTVSAAGSTWSDLKGSVDISLDSLSPHSRLQPRGQAGPTLAQMQQQSTVQMNSLTMQMGQANLGGMQPMPMSGMMPQQQMGYGGGMPYGSPGVQPVTSPTSAAKASLQKK